MHNRKLLLFLFFCVFTVQAVFAADTNILTEKEQKTFEEFGGGWESPSVFSSNRAALKYLKILVKGDHHTIRWYSNNNDLPTEKDKKQTYSEDLSTALYNFFPRSNKEEVFDLLVRILQTKWEYPGKKEDWGQVFNLDIS